MNELFSLAVGQQDSLLPDADFTRGMRAIGDSLQQHGAELAHLWDNKGDPEFVKIAPTCARLMLEQSLATTLARLDPIRFISIVKGSSSPDFLIGSKNASSFYWSKDVLPDVKPTAAGLWSQETLSKTLHRAMLDGHLADYLFGSAHVKAIEGLTDKTAGDAELPQWIISLLKYESGTHVLSTLRKKAGESFSSLSKGIHFEFFKGNTTGLSVEEITAAVSGAIAVAATTGLYSHFTDIALRRISQENAISHFLFLVKKFDCQ
ncbi:MULTISPECIES: hypothetical protein [Paraburkholderia]|uniref:hypothetical protein n=1 Tax=Paraburkholderia TaxID=1822464 RepID=UPI00190A5F1A|nr:hypothetical protein [Paraburkholderia nemoris]MBK3737757.1 hypothetical protein [Paraburkholderia aspalathi]CAE6696213.1 hypothetical protein R69619_00492 [Paraburkholderia nemoris]